jgi:hypothetical protein
MRPHVLGGLARRNDPKSEPSEKEGDQSNWPKIVVQYVEPGDKPDIDPKEEARNTLHYAWGVSPDFSELLDTVARAARDFEPSESGMIGAAIAKREKNNKTEYLRAFGKLLTDVHHLTLTGPVMKAMAILASVVIDVDVTYDDVRKALPKPGD